MESVKGIFDCKIVTAPKYRMGEPILLTFEITNTSKDAYQLLIWQTPLEKEVFNFFTVERDGEKIEYDGRLVKRGDPPAEAYVKIGPGETLSEEVDLSTSYAFDKPGEYTVTVSGRIHDAFKISSAGKQAPRRRDQFESFELPQPKASFTVAPGGPSRLTSGQKARKEPAGSRSGESDRPHKSAPKVPGFVGGTTAQQSEVSVAHTNAAYYASLSDEQLVNTTGNTNALYKDWFGTFDQNRYDTVTNHYSDIADKMVTDQFTYDLSGSGCKAGDYAYTYRFTRKIWLCGSFWTAPHFGTDSKFGTLIHELSHAVCGTDDVVYGSGNASNLASTKPADAIRNADNHEYFAENLATSDYGESCGFVIDRDHYGQDEIDGVRSQPGGAVVKTAFWVVVDGFTASELGIVGATSLQVGPPIAFSPSAGVKATCTSLDSTDSAFPGDEIQRFRFGYDVDFGNDDTAFTSFAGDTETVTLTTTMQKLPAMAQVEFMKQPDPYIRQGADTWWLSSDIRLIQVAEGDTRFGVKMGNDPFQFLTNLTSALETGQGAAGGESFDANTGEDSEVISVAPQTKRNGNLVNAYNFAIARVHYRGKLLDANHVRVFFRLFAANSTATEFQPGSTYSRDPAAYPVPASQYGQHVTPTPGVIAGEYVTIPCFGTQRHDPTQQGAANTLPSLQFDSPINDRTISKTGGSLHDAFYGSFLDINQTAGVLPKTPPPGNENGPWPPSSQTALEPLQQAFIRNEHQCLMAEIVFDPDPVGTGTQPWNSDKLAQRNISWSYVANPGLSASRQALETFEVRPTPPTIGPAENPDEIMIDWTNVPAGQQAEIYLPAVSADSILTKASRLYGIHHLERIDANTIGCATGGVSYIPLPAGSGDGANFAGLMSVRLPQGIKRGQLYKVVVRQLTNMSRIDEPLMMSAQVESPGSHHVRRWRRVRGTFQINIPVSTKELLLEKEELRLSIFRWIAEAIPSKSRWYPVFKRYLELIATRVSEMGGDPTKIKPSPNGYAGLPSYVPVPVEEEEHERRLSFTGKIAGLAYDHFGDFEGFLLETEEGEHRFLSREGEVEELAERAWRERIRITVWTERDEPHRPQTIILRGPPPDSER